MLSAYGRPHGIKLIFLLSFCVLGTRVRYLGGGGSVAAPDPGPGAFLTLGSDMGKKSGSGFGMNNPDHISESLETIFLG